MAVIRTPSPRTVERTLARRRRFGQQWYIDRALEDVAAVGRLTATRRRWLADRLDVSERQARRLVAQDGYRDGEALSTLWDARGNIAKAARNLGVARSTLADAVLLDVPRAELAEMRRGERAHRGAELNLPQLHVFGACWQFDVKQVSTWVRCPVTDAPIQPRVGHTKCPASRAIVGAWPVRHRFRVADVIDAVRWAIDVRPEEGPFGGTPDAIQMDNAGEHLPIELRHFLDRYDIEPVTIKDHTPDANGSVESFHAFVESEYAAATTFYAHRPTSRNNEPQLVLGEPPTWLEFCEGYAQFISDYNHGHRHRKLDGQTPAQRWRELAREQARAT